MKGCAADIVSRYPEYKNGKQKIFILTQSLKLPFKQLIDESNFSWDIVVIAMETTGIRY